MTGAYCSRLYIGAANTGHIMTFNNKTVLITGGGTGIGKATAARFLAEGANLVLNGRRGEMLTQAAAELDAPAERIALVPGDIALPETSQKMVTVAIERFGGVDILVNNAGIFRPTGFLDHTPEDVNAYLDIIFKGTFFASQAAIPEIRKRGGGAIVNVGSLWASQAVGATPSSAYSAAKAGVHSLTRNLAIEFAGDNIRVNAVAPAVVETPVYSTFLTPEQIEAVLPTFHAFHPLGRNGQATDVAEAILFLSGNTSAWITGVVLPVDGGVMAGRN